MKILFFMIPVMLFIGVMLVLGFAWALKSGQFEDLEAQKYKIFFED